MTMISQKLLVLLQSFSNYERKNFGKFIQSPFHNENSDLIKLFEIIDIKFQDKASQSESPIELEKELVLKKLKGNESFNDNHMRKISSDLLKKIYSYLSYKQFKKNPNDELIFLLKSLNTPILKKHFDGVIRQINLNQQKSQFRTTNDHLNNYLIEYSKFSHLEKKNEKTKTFENLENADFHLDCFYISKKLKNYCDSLGYKNIFSVNPNIELLPDFLENLKHSKFLKQDLIKAYYLVIYLFLEPEDESHFTSLKSLLKKCATTFSKKELNTLYIYLKNYCIRNKINNGQSEYYFELFDIFKTLIEYKIIFHNNQIDPQDYKNIITVGLNINEFDWTEQFIQAHTQNLPKQSQDNDLNYNLAKVYFHKHDYKKVIEQLREVEYKSWSYALGGKLMLLKTYYELDEYNALDSLLDSFSIYLRRNNLIAKDKKQQYLNVLRFTRKLSSLAPYDKKRIEKLKEQINNCKALAAKKWLVEKVEELEK